MRKRNKVVIHFIGTLILAFFGGLLYRLGGQGKHWNTKVRDLGVPVIAGLYFWLFLGVQGFWVYFFSLGLLFGALTTYWDHWGTDDVEWYEWALTGLCYGLAAIPLAISGQCLWLWVITRALVLAGLTCIWSNRIEDDVVEECGRGALIILTLPMLGW